MDKNIKHIQFRADSETLEKIKYIAEYYGQSLTGHIKSLVNYSIKRFVKKVGPIMIDSKDEK